MDEGGHNAKRNIVTQYARRCQVQISERRPCADESAPDKPAFDIDLCGEFEVEKGTTYTCNSSNGIQPADPYLGHMQFIPHLIEDGRAA